MNKLFTKIAAAFVGMAMAIGVGFAIGNGLDEIKPVRAAATETITLQESTFSGMGNNNYGSGVEYTGTVTSTSTSQSVSVGGHYITKNSGWQWQANNANVYNITELTGRITNITVTQTGTARAFTAYAGNEQLFASSETGTGKSPSGDSLGAKTAATMSWDISAEKDYTFFAIHKGANAGKVTSVVVTYEVASSTPKYSVTYDPNGATSGTAPTDATAYESGQSFTVLGNTGNLAKTGYIFGGWNTKADGTGYARTIGDSYTIAGDATLYAKWDADTLNSLSISGSMTKTSYLDGDAWNPAGFTVTGNYQSGATPDLTSQVTWSYYVGGAVQATASAGDTSVVVRATFGGKYVESSAQTVTVIEGATYDLSSIDGFTSWTNSYTNHNVSSADIDAGLAIATMAFSITNKQASGIGSAYPCIGAKTNSELQCLVFTLTEANKKITSVSITFVTRYTSTYPSVYLHKGNGIATAAIDSLTMSGSAGDEHTLGCANLNDTVFTVGYNAHQTGSNGAVGIKSISIGLEDQASFGTVHHIAVTGLPNTVYHVGEIYDSTGLTVTAYDGANEATANFKDVTAEISTGFTSGIYAFDDSDVPTIDMWIEYEDEHSTVFEAEVTFHVYALAEYELVTSELADWSGNYLIVGTNSSSELGAMNGGLANPDVEAGYKVVTADANDVIEAGQELEWTIAAVAGGYSIQGKSGKYIGSLTAKSNGMLVSDSALVNTISFNDETDSATITGTNTYILNLNTTGDRFRYYASGSVKLYKLVETNNAALYAQQFLSALQNNICQESAGVVTTNKAALISKWAELKEAYSGTSSVLTSVERESFRLAVGSETGTEIQQAVALYDHIVSAYGAELGSGYNFMSRTVAPANSSLRILENSNATATVALLMTVISVCALGAFVFLKRKKEN